MNAARALESVDACEIRFDALTRTLYATDASIYQIEPWGVAFPKNSAEAASIIRAAADEGIAVTPRGAGTGLAGGALGSGLIVDFSRHNRGITEFNRDARTVRVGPGVVLDTLNRFLSPHGLCFGPDVATSSRATLGGMIANNSSGARAPVYGATIDHVRSLDIVLADGRIVTIGGEDAPLRALRDEVDALVRANAAGIDARMPPGNVKRWPGYGLERWLRRKPDLTSILGGSEGTLAAIVSAELELSPIPGKKSLGVLYFDSVPEAMGATVEILDLAPAAIEHVDRVLFDQTRGQVDFRESRALLGLDQDPCESILIVEFYDDADDEKLNALMARKLGLRRDAFTVEREMALIWHLRKAGLSLLTGCAGPRKPVAGIEDAAVPPERLPEYVAGLRGIMQPLGVEGSYYGHAASGLLHVRPVIDLHSAEDLRKFRQVADEVSALVRQFKGSIAAEHGVGIARTEYLEDHLGPELLHTTREIKRLFDPHNVFNPGKIIADGRYAIDTNLRWGAGYGIAEPGNGALAFAARDLSFVGNLEQCNGCGGCRKETPTMCPTFLATGDEIQSTRGRANVIRAALDGRLGPRHRALLLPELDEALSNCLSCKACKTECPSNVDLALLKTELLDLRNRRLGTPLRTRLMSRVDLLGKWGSRFARIANAALCNRLLRYLMEDFGGIAAKRPLPAYASEPFDAWFHKRKRRTSGGRGRVVLWDDCFVRYNEPQIGRAAVRVLEALGYAIELPAGRACCGRPAFSLGRLDLARAFARINTRILESSGDAPIIFLEPSCYSMIYEDYRELGIGGAETIRARSVLFEEFAAGALPGHKQVFKTAEPAAYAVHVHCHAKALTGAKAGAEALTALPGVHAEALDTGCCGMAGAFGALSEKYGLSVEVARPMKEKIAALPKDARVAACGTSCRHQIEHVCGVKPVHVAEAMAERLEINADTN